MIARRHNQGFPLVRGTGGRAHNQGLLAAIVNLLTNGDFTSNTTGWSLDTTYGTGTFVSSAGAGVLTCTSSIGIIAYPTGGITTIPGHVYTVSGTVAVASGSPGIFVKKSNDTAATVSPITLASAAGPFSTTFTADATTTYLLLQVNGAGTGASFDNLVVHA